MHRIVLDKVGLKCTLAYPQPVEKFKDPQTYYNTALTIGDVHMQDEHVDSRKTLAQQAATA
eukprot:2385574-Ditylum_brightwellii.AAC.1